MAAADFGNRHIVSNVGDNISVQLPSGVYKCLQGESPDGIAVSESGLITGTATTPGIRVMILECCQ